MILKRCDLNDDLEALVVIALDHRAQILRNDSDAVRINVCANARIIQVVREDERKRGKRRKDGDDSDCSRAGMTLHVRRDRLEIRLGIYKPRYDARVVFHRRRAGVTSTLLCASRPFSEKTRRSDAQDARGSVFINTLGTSCVSRFVNERTKDTERYVTRCIRERLMRFVAAHDEKVQLQSKVADELFSTGEKNSWLKTTETGDEVAGEN